MADCMKFPDTVEEFMEQYKVTDYKQVYTNGTELVPIFRMKQWFERQHSADVAPVVHGRWIDMGDHGDWQWETDGRGNCWHLWECNRCNGKVKIKSDYCPNCGAKMDGEE